MRTPSSTTPPTQKLTLGATPRKNDAQPLVVAFVVIVAVKLDGFICQFGTHHRDMVLLHRLPSEPEQEMPFDGTSSYAASMCSGTV